MHSHSSPFFFSINSTELPNFKKDSWINFLFRFVSMYFLTIHSSWSDILYIGPVFSCVPSLSFISWFQSWYFESCVSFCSWLLVAPSTSFLLRCTSSVIQFIYRFSFFSYFLPRMIWCSPSSIILKLSLHFLLLT